MSTIKSKITRHIKKGGEKKSDLWPGKKNAKSKETDPEMKEIMGRADKNL